MTEATRPTQPDREDQQTDGLSTSLIKGLAILAAFTAEQSALGIAELADRLGMSRSTTHRYACTLVELGYLEQDPRRRYRLGRRAADLGMSALAGVDLRVRARPYLLQLRRQSSETVSLAVLDGSWIICLEHLPGGPHATHLPFGEGSRIPAHASAMGKLLLSRLSRAEQGKLLGKTKLDSLAPNTITNKRVLRAQLFEIQQSRLAFDDQELLAGVRSLATPIYGEDGEVQAAVALTVPVAAYSLAQLSERYSQALLDTARGISALTR